MLPVGKANDAAEAVRRSEIVRDVELLERKDARAALGEVTRGGAAHAADAEDDDVVDHFRGAAELVSAEPNPCGAFITTGDFRGSQTPCWSRNARTRRATRSRSRSTATR